MFFRALPHPEECNFSQHYYTMESCWTVLLQLLNLLPLLCCHLLGYLLKARKFLLLQTIYRPPLHYTHKRSFLIHTLQTPFSELLPPFNSTLNRKATIVKNNYNKTHPCKTMLLGTLYQFTVISFHIFKETKLTTLFS